MARDFYPFVEEGDQQPCEVHHPARIAVYDDASAAPRVVVVEPKDVREYLEEITATVNRLSHEQGGTIPFMVIREIVENFIHAYFQAPTISILDGGNTIRFSDQGPGIKEKDLALEYGTSSATEEMKRYIRGVGSGLPYVQQYMADKGGSLEIEDNIAGGTVVTISTHPSSEARAVSGARGPQEEQPAAAPQTWAQPETPATTAQPWQQPMWPAQQPTYVPQPQPWQQAPTQTWMPPQPQPQQFQQPVQPPVQQQPQSQPQPQPPTPSPQAPIPDVTLSERDRQVMSYLSQHESVGPTDLVQTWGSSAATWSRVLSSLAARGLVLKDAQKYRPTTVGRAFL